MQLLFLWNSSQNLVLKGKLADRFICKMAVEPLKLGENNLRVTVTVTHKNIMKFMQ